MSETRSRPCLPPNKDPTRVYFIHPSDSNTTQLVSVKFNDTGFNNWKCSMMLSLLAKIKIDFVDGIISKPEPTTVEYKAWERCNDLVCAWLLFNMDDVIAKSVMFLKSAREIWIELEERFGYTSMTQVYSLEQQLAELSQGSNNISEFFTKIKMIWDAVNDANPFPTCTCLKCTCNLEHRVYQMQQDQRMIQFIMKLNEEFASVRGNILMQYPMPNIANAYRLFAQEEIHKELSSVTSQTESLACFSKKKNFKNFKPQSMFNKNQFVPNKTTKGVQAGAPGRKPQYFRTHCKIPPGFKSNRDKKVAATIQADLIKEEGSSSTTFSAAQYNQFLEMLNKRQQSGFSSVKQNEDS
ncbi:uncharacterized protein LOC141703761 [Apium graveolens]|uniref:uncharacterized protein LOC141659714 n=2 Tax=Apium graveolens TaxID=4045 RepID=UPI003D7A9F82